jgi:hypothetical protein
LFVVVVVLIGPRTGVETGTVGVRTGAVGARTGAVGTRTGAVGARTGAVGTRTGAVGTRTGAVGTRTGAVGTRTGAVGTRTGAGTVAVELVKAAVLTRTLGEFCTSRTTPIDPSATKACFTSAGVIKGLRCRYNATTPVTIGVAILVPEMVLEAVLLPVHALVISDPGLWKCYIVR